MRLLRYLTASTLLVTIIREPFVAATSEEIVRVTPERDLSLPINSPENVTYVCNVTSNVTSNVEGRRAIWEVEGRQIQLGNNPTRTLFESIGIFIEQLEEEEGVVTLTVNRDARMTYRETGIMVRCLAVTATQPLVFGSIFFIRIYGRPDVPEDLRLEGSRPAILMWSRPSNIPTDIQVNYTVTINSTTSELGGVYMVVDMLQLSVQFLEDELLNTECQGFVFSVIASVLDADDSMPAFTMDTIPISTNVSFIDSSLQVDSVRFLGDDADVSVTISFQAVASCSDDYQIQNYTILVQDSLGPTLLAMPTDSVITRTLTSGDLPILVHDQTFQLGVKVCSNIICRNSTLTVPLNTSDVQTAQVVFYENNVFLSCSFADDSSASGCVFTFQVNQNGTGNEQFVLLQSVGGQQCNTTDNQQNGYTEISVQDLEDVVMDQLSLGQLSLLAEVTVLDSAADYSQQTGCSVPTDVRNDVSNVVSIVVPIVVVLVVLTILTVLTVVILVLYYRGKKEMKDPEFAESEFPDTLSVTIKSDHQKLLTNSPTSRHTPSVMQSLPVTTRPMKLDPQRSLPRVSSDNTALFFSVPPERAPPVEVELHRDSVKLKLNKSALRAMARFHYMAMRHAQSSEGAAPESLSADESQSLLTVSDISRVHIGEDFKSMCCNLPPVEEGGEEEEELKSWGIINTPPLSPPAKDEQTSPV